MKLVRQGIAIFATSCIGLCQAAPENLQWSLTAEDGSKYTVRGPDGFISADHSITGTIHWFSQNKVQYLGISAPQGGESRHGADYRVDVWNVESGAVATLAVVTAAGQPAVCFNDGYITVTWRDLANQLRVLRGSPQRLEPSDARKKYSAIFCRANEEVPSAPAWMTGRTLVWLARPNEGFLDFGSREKVDESVPVKLYRPGEAMGQGAVLPLKSRETALKAPYFPYEDAFFIDRRFDHFPPGKDVSYPVYWLRRSGQIEKITDIPWGPWRSNASFWAMPTKVGVALVSHNFNVREPADIANAGLYLVRGTRVTRIVKGWILDSSVSPDGCSLAFSFAPTVTHKTNTLKVVDLCTGN